MEPIISPWLVYGISVLAKFQMAIHFCLSLSIVGLCIMAPAFLNGDDVSDDGRRMRTKALKAVLIFGAIEILLPDKDTLMTMLALQYVTPDNVQAVQGNIVDFVGQIAEAVKNAK
ncbi:MAG: hypothetical protein IJ709_13860 [Selenomonas sp.]|nr:hypothetical protein [Selenomonas sp.]